MIITEVVIQSLEDAKSGKALIEGIPKERITKAKELTVGILEGGMQSGKTSVMFILKDGNTAKVAEMSVNNFEMLAGAVKGAVERFEGKGV